MASVTSSRARPNDDDLELLGAEVFRGGSARVFVSLSGGPASVLVTLRGEFDRGLPERAETSVRLELGRVADPAKMGRAWPLTDAIDLGISMFGDPFVYLLEEGSAWISGVRANHPRTEYPYRAAAPEGLRAFLDRAASEAVRRCDPRARRVALGFHPSFRYHVYHRLLADESGRIYELAESCPGLIILAAHCANNGPELSATASEIFTRVKEGEKLQPIIDDAVFAWNCFLVRDEFVDDFPKISERRSQLIRRARAGATHEAMCAEVPPPFEISDIPRGPEANAVWYEVMGRVATTIDRFDMHFDARGDGVAMFFSKNAHLASELEEEFGIPHLAFVDALTSRACHRHRVSRRSDPRAQARVAIHWLESTPMSVSDLDPDDALDPAPLPVWKNGEFEISLLTTPSEMDKAGSALQNCLGDLAEQAIGCGIHYYLGRRDGKPSFSIEIEETDGAWTLTEARGKGNADLDPDERRVVDAWFVTLRESAGGSWGETE